MPVINIVSDASDGTIQANGNFSWATARATSSSFINNASQGIRAACTLKLIGGNPSYILHRGFLKFDTSAIGAGNTVTGVRLKLTPISLLLTVATPTDFDIIIMKQDWSSLTLTNATDRETAYDGCLAGTQDAVFAAYSDLTLNNQTISPALSPAHVNPTGYTCYSLIADFDLNDVTPIRAAGSTSQSVAAGFAGGDHATAAYHAVLEVTYTEGGGGQDLTLECTSGSYALTGQNVAINRGFTLALGKGSYSLTGKSIEFTLTRHYILEAQSANYNLTGSDVSFSVKRNYVLAIESGNYAITGSDVSITASISVAYTLSCEAGMFSLTGKDITINKGLIMPLSSGAYSVIGHDVKFPFERTLSLEAGNYSLSGKGVDFTKALIFSIESGGYILTGSDVYFFAGNIVTPACRTFVIVAENRIFTIPYENRTTTIEAENRTYKVKC